MTKPISPKPFKNEGEDLVSRSKKGLKKGSNSQLTVNKSTRQSGIPKEIANRMARRIAVTSGIHTLSRMSVFIVSYLLVVKGIVDVPPGITLLSSALCFLIGLIGLSYGIVSASWEKTPGTILGLENINPNVF